MIIPTFYCDGPDCLTNIEGDPGGDPDAGWITIFEHQYRVVDEYHFCSWDCVLRHAANEKPLDPLRVEEQ